MSLSNKETVKKVNAAFAANDLEGFLAVCRDDVEWTIVGDRTSKGKQAIREWMGPMSHEPPRFTPLQHTAEGDFVTEYGEMTMNENGKDVPYSYCDVYRFSGEQIAQLISFVIKTEEE